VAQSTLVTLIDWAGVLGRGILGITFLVAGLAKLASPQTAATAVAEFGAPAFARPLLRFLPHLEVVVAASLAFAATAWFGAWTAAALLMVFIAAIQINLARGRRPDCNCFGQVRPAPISAFTVLRNVVLLAIAGWLIVSGPPGDSADLWTWLRTLTAKQQLIAAAVVVTLLVVGQGVLRGYVSEPPADAARPTPPPPARPRQAAARGTAASGVTARADAVPARTPAVPARKLTGNGLSSGVVAPGFELPDLSGQTHTLASLLALGKPIVLVFSSPGCESCQALVPKLPPQVATHADRVTLVLVSRDTVERNLAKLKDPGDLLVLRQRDYEVAEDYDITTSPAGIVVSPDGMIASPLAMGGLAILDLIRRTAEPADEPAV